MEITYASSQPMGTIVFPEVVYTDQAKNVGIDTDYTQASSPSNTINIGGSIGGN